MNKFVDVNFAFTQEYLPRFSCFSRHFILHPSLIFLSRLYFYVWLFFNVYKFVSHTYIVVLIYTDLFTYLIRRTSCLYSSRFAVKKKNKVYTLNVKHDLMHMGVERAWVEVPKQLLCPVCVRACGQAVDELAEASLVQEQPTNYSLQKRMLQYFRVTPGPVFIKCWVQS